MEFQLEREYRVLGISGLYLTVGEQERGQREWVKTCSKGPQTGTQTQAGWVKTTASGVPAQAVELQSTRV